MALIKKADLIYTDYSWTVLNSDNPKITGKPDSTLLNRKEGYEILYFINKFAEIHELKTKESAEKIEKKIRHEVPTAIHSQEKIETWIINNWN